MRAAGKQIVGLILAGAAASASAGAQPAATHAEYAITERIAGPDGGGWDLASIDVETRRLYLGRDAGVLSFDLDSRHFVPVFVPGAGVHAALVVPNTGLGASTNGDKNTVSLFDARTGHVVSEVPVGEDPDALVYDPRSMLLAVMNHKGGTVSLVDIVTCGSNV